MLIAGFRCFVLLDEEKKESNHTFRSILLHASPCRHSIVLIVSFARLDAICSCHIRLSSCELLVSTGGSVYSPDPCRASRRQCLVRSTTDLTDNGEQSGFRSTLLCWPSAGELCFSILPHAAFTERHSRLATVYVRKFDIAEYNDSNCGWYYLFSLININGYLRFISLHFAVFDENESDREREKKERKERKRIFISMWISSIIYICCFRFFSSSSSSFVCLWFSPSSFLLFLRHCFS